MPNFKAILLGTALSLAVPGLTLAQSEPAETPAESTPMVQATADTVLATVNGTAITVGHVAAALSGLSPEEQRLPPQILLQGLTERLIQQEALAAGAEDVSKIVVLSLENDRRAMVAAERVQQIAAELEVTDEEITAVYDTRLTSWSRQRKRRKIW